LGLTLANHSAISSGIPKPGVLSLFLLITKFIVSPFDQ